MPSGGLRTAYVVHDRCGLRVSHRRALWLRGFSVRATQRPDDGVQVIRQDRGALGKGWFLFDAAVHAPAADPAHVELGQLLAMKVDDFGEVYDRH